MLISIVTLNYKKSHLTIACLESLNKFYKNEFEEGQMEVIVVDNASGDDSVKNIKEIIEEKKFKNNILIENDENSGFSKGCNLGAKKAKGKYLLFLNNDTVVCDNAFIKMARYLDESPNVAILGGQLKNEDGSLQPSTGKFYTLTRAIMLLLGFQKFGLLDKSPKEIERVDWVKGGLLMIVKDVFDKLGGFDEKIFMYTEDMELCYRALLNGYKTYFYPYISVLHAEYGSTNRTFAIVNIYKNLLYFYKKHRTKFEYILIKIALLTKAYALQIIGILTKNSYLKDTYSQAIKAIN